ncbi:MAG: Ig-like domain-containing protein [Chloroflexota bacterium]
MHIRRHYILSSMILLLWGILILGWPMDAQAGIYDSNTEVTYTEYWVHHSEFIGKCSDPVSGNEFYIEPTSGCQITLDFSISEDLTLASKVEIYLDLWRNHDEKRAEFKLNNNDWRRPNVGEDWSRTPYVAEVPISELNQGGNVITFKGQGYHVHDIAFRVYGANSLSAPSGSLVTIKDDSNTKTFSGGGVLNVNNDQLELSATVGAGANLLEFHAFYDGYDEDNDGIFRDWHNISRNNWNPGGKFPAALGGTINHVGTVKVSGAGTYSITWPIPHIINQNGVKFKIRVLDNSGNVREAAGGVSNSFELRRNIPVVYFTNPDFDDIILWHDGDFPPTASATVDLPPLADFDAGYLVGAYWLRPNVYFNGDSQSFANRYNLFPNYPTTDDWELSILSIGNTGNGYIPFSKLKSGENSFLFENRDGSWGAFVEKPGPMVVLRGKSSPTADTTAPQLIDNSPEDSATGVAEDTNIALRLIDYNSGLDLDSFSLSVDDVTNMPYNDSRITRRGSIYDMTFTYNPSNDFDEGEVVDVSLTVSDQSTNTLSNETFSFTITEPDDVPPVISEVQCVADSDKLTILWTTDEPASSLVTYGITDTLGSNVSNPAFVTSHVIEIAGLTSETDYYYQIYSEDESTNGTFEPETGTEICTTAGPSTITSDDFNQCELDTNLWSYADPQGLATMTATQTQIQFDIPANSDYDVWTGGNNGARIMQATNNATFEIDVKFETGIANSRQIQGVIIEEDDDTYLRVSFGMDNSGNARIYAFYLDGGSGTEKLSGNGRPLDASVDPNGPLYLRVWRQSPTEWAVFYSGDGITWLQSGGGYKFTQAINVTGIGPFAGNATGTDAYTSIVDYFFRTDLPIEPEDGKSLQLGTTVLPVGTGMISMTPSCGNPVELTAEPIPGWTFDSWSTLQGSVITTTTNPVDVTFVPGEIVTANFAQNYYTIYTSVEDGIDGLSGGTITLSLPASEEGYEYNQLVTLTAQPNEGWQFDEWGGDVSGTDFVTMTTMLNNRNVVAYFSRIPYTVGVTITGQGAVSVDPDTGPYYLNQIVSLEAVAEPGWSFDSWGNDLTGITPQSDLTIDGDMSVTALFTQDQYTLTIGNSGTGTGSVVITPTKATYVYGEEITLMATASPGSQLTSWSGAGLSGNELTVTLTMTQSESVVAEFTQEFYTVTVQETAGGMITLSPPSNPDGYVYNEIVTASALPTSGYTFQNWTGALDGDRTPALHTVVESTEIGAVFTLLPDDTKTYTLTVMASTGGSVLPMSGAYEEGTVVVLTAMADDGFAFVNWTNESGAVLSTAETWNVTMISDITIKANFEAIEAGEFTLMKQVSGRGSITSDPTGGSFPDGTEISLTAIPDEGWTFTSWSGDVAGNDATAMLTINADSVVTATFTQNKYTISTVIVGNGEAAVSAPADPQGYVFGEQVTLAATPDEGWLFSGWESSMGTATGDNPVGLTVVGSTTITATFIPTNTTVSGMSVETEGQGDVQISPQKEVYQQDEEIAFTAVPQPGWRFVRWESNVTLNSGSITESTITIMAIDSIEIRAIFEEVVDPGTTVFLPLINN